MPAETIDRPIEVAAAAEDVDEALRRFEDVVGAGESLRREHRAGDAAACRVRRAP